jgi:hypothetical protein
MEPEPEDEEQAAAAAATEAPDKSAVLAARVSVVGHGVTAKSTTLDVSEWKLTAVQVREVAGALPQLLCLRELMLDGVPVSGATPRYGDFQYGVEAVDADLGMFRALCEALRALQELTSLSLGGCYLGPQALAVLAEVVFRDASAVLTSVNCLKNPLGDGGLVTLVTAVEASSVGSICGLTEGQTTVDWSQQDLGPFDCKIIAADFGFRRFSAVLASLTLSGNQISGTKYKGGKWVYDADLSGFTSLCQVLGKLIEVNLSDCGLGPASMPELAKTFSDADAVVKKIVLSQNKLFGANQYGNHTVDADQSGWAALCDALPGSPVEELDVADVGMGVTGVTSLAKAISSMAVLASLTLSGNKITGTKYERRQWIYDVDLSGFTSLCQVLGRLNEVNLSDCGLGPASMPELAKVFSNADAALAVVNVVGNAIGEPGARTLIEAFDGNSKIQSLLGINPGSTSADFSKTSMQPHDCIILAHELNASRAAAAVKVVTASGNPLTGGEPEWNANDATDCWHQTDGKDISGVSVLFPAMTQVITLNVSDCGLGPTAMPELAKLVCDASAVLASLTLDQNGIFGELYPWGDCKEADKYAEESTPLLDAIKMSNLTSLSLRKTGMGPKVCSRLATSLSAAIENVNVSGCHVTQEVAAQLLTAANEASRARLRASQVLAFSEALHARLGSECLLQAVALDTDVWRRVAENVRERHGHELMCSQLAQAGQTWFEVTVEGLIAEGVPR